MHTDGGGGGEGREGGRGCGGVGVETILFVSVVSLCIRNTETNRNKTFNGFENEPKQTRNRSCFGYFRFEPKFLFICFLDTLLSADILAADYNSHVQKGGIGPSCRLSTCFLQVLF